MLLWTATRVHAADDAAAGRINIKDSGLCGVVCVTAFNTVVAGDSGIRLSLLC